MNYWNSGSSSIGFKINAGEFSEMFTEWQSGVIFIICAWYSLEMTQYYKMGKNLLFSSYMAAVPTNYFRTDIDNSRPSEEQLLWQPCQGHWRLLIGTFLYDIFSAWYFLWRRLKIYVPSLHRYEEEISKRTTAENDFVGIKKVTILKQKN